MNTLKWRLSLALGALAILAPPAALAQAPEDVEEVVRAFFEGRNLAPGLAAFTCPGEDAFNDAVVEAFIRPRPLEEVVRLAGGWSYVPPCRADQILGWYEAHAVPVFGSEGNAWLMAHRMLDMDSATTIRILRRAAVDPSIPDGGRGGYQRFVFWRLDGQEQVDLYIETFEKGIQAGLYPNLSLGRLVLRPDEGPANALRLLSGVLRYPENAQASRILGVVLSVATSEERDVFSPSDRRRIWDLLEPNLGRLPPPMREAIESHEVLLKAGPDPGLSPLTTAPAGSAPGPGPRSGAPPGVR